MQTIINRNALLFKHLSPNPRIFGQRAFINSGVVPFSKSFNKPSSTIFQPLQANNPLLSLSYKHFSTVTPFPNEQQRKDNSKDNNSKESKKSFLDRILSIIKWGILLIGGSLALITFGVAVRQKNSEYPLHKRMAISLDSILRYLRTLWAEIVIFADYKITYKLHPSSDPESRPYLSKLHKRSAERLLRVCKANGGIYIKSGQYLASMNHVLPREVIETLSVLQDKAPYVSFEEVQKIFLEDFQQPLQNIFSEFDEEPLAAASLAQVHRAVLKDGREVAVKIQYPTIKDRFGGDMWSMEFCLLMIQKLFPDFGEITWMGEDIRYNLAKELDFVNEAHNALRAKENLKAMKNVHVPEPYLNLTTRRVLTMEFIHGIKITDLKTLKENNLSVPEIAQTMIEIFARQIFCYGFVHCDPHPGNLLVRKLSNGRPEVILLDHGLYRELPDKFRNDFCQVWRALILRDEENLRKYSLSLGIKDYDIFAVMLLMRSYKGANVGLTKQMTRQEIKELYVGMRNRMPDLMQMMKVMPRELLLILRNFNLVRSINKELGAPVNRFVILARVAAEGSSIKESNNSHLGWLQRTRNWLKQTKNGIVFDFNLRFATFMLYLFDVYVDVMKRWGKVPAVITMDQAEDVIEGTLMTIDLNNVDTNVM